MVVRLVAHRQTLLHQLSPALGINTETGRVGGRLGVVPKGIRQMVKQTGRRQQDGRVTELPDAFQKELRIGIALLSGGGQPFACGFLIPWYIFAHQVELAEGILRILIAQLGRGSQILYRPLRILGDAVAGKIQLAQTVVCILAALRCRLFSGRLRIPPRPSAFAGQRSETEPEAPAWSD